MTGSVTVIARPFMTATRPRSLASPQPMTPVESRRLRYFVAVAEEIGSAAFALGDPRATNLTACLLAQAYQSLWLVDSHDACERSISLTVSSDSSALPD